MQWGSFGNSDGQFYFARGIAVDQNDGLVYVWVWGIIRSKSLIPVPTFFPNSWPNGAEALAPVMPVVL